jgi:hypothetical protein
VKPLLSTAQTRRPVLLCIALPTPFQNLQLVRYYEIAVISLLPRPVHEVVRSEHRRHSARKSERPADPLAYLHIAQNKNTDGYEV